MYKFCSSSEALLQRCIEAASSHKTNNKWTQNFPHFIINYKLPVRQNLPLPSETIVIEDEEIGVQVSAFEKEEKNSVHSCFLEDAGDIELDEIELNEKFNKDDMKKLALCLSDNCVGKLCIKVFDMENTEFIDNFYSHFFPAYLRMELNSSKIELLIQAKEAHPLAFEKLLEIIFKDLKMPSKVLPGLFSVLDESEKNRFLMSIFKFISKEEFSYHMATLFTVYNDCDKTEQLQNLILDKLMKFSQEFKSNREYGSFLLSCLQCHNSLNLQLDCMKVEKLLENHESVFKKPCLILLDNIKHLEEE